jgi:hypothetical protein
MTTIGAKISGPILALDLGLRTGYAFGIPGSAPLVRAFELGKKGDPHRSIASSLMRHLRGWFNGPSPSLVTFASPPTIPWHAAAHSREETARLQYGLPMIVMGVCDEFGVAIEEVAESTARKHFTGRGNFGGREATKRAVISQAIVLGMLPRGCVDDNQADACCLWDWACATHGGRAISISSFALFDQGKRG